MIWRINFVNSTLHRLIGAAYLVHNEIPLETLHFGIMVIRYPIHHRRYMYTMDNQTSTFAIQIYRHRRKIGKIVCRAAHCFHIYAGSPKAVICHKRSDISTYNSKTGFVSHKPQKDQTIPKPVLTYLNHGSALFERRVLWLQIRTSWIMLEVSWEKQET